MNFGLKFSVVFNEGYTNPRLVISTQTKAFEVAINHQDLDTVVSSKRKELDKVTLWVGIIF